MRKIILLTFFACFSMQILRAQDQTSDSILRHVVLFKFKDNATPDNITTVAYAFKALPSKINQIKNFEWGMNNSPENLNEGLTHCFLLSFASEEDRNNYLVHPAHKAFGEILNPYLDKVVVIDYWLKK